MEACFYDDYIMPGASSEEVKIDKTKLTLDFSQAGKNAKRQNPLNSILTSPDLNLLTLGSPELEKLIMSSCGGILTTPTPSQLGLKGNLNLSVTEEQEQYAHGFVEALAKLHKEQGTPGGDFKACTAAESTATNSVVPVSSVMPQSSSTTSVSSSSKACVPTTSIPTNSTISTGALPFATLRPIEVAIYPTFQAAASDRVGLLQNATYGNYLPMQQQPAQAARVSGIKLEANPAEQVVPGTPPPPLPPIDLNLQEAVKNERKKQRNRQAASKCRKRKLERESDLEQKVDELKKKNTSLQSEAQDLRQQVMSLKQFVMSHVKGGCEIMLANEPTGL